MGICCCLLDPQTNSGAHHFHQQELQRMHLRMGRCMRLVMRCREVRDEAGRSASPALAPRISGVMARLQSGL